VVGVFCAWDYDWILLPLGWNHLNPLPQSKEINKKKRKKASCAKDRDFTQEKHLSID